jgi:uncharacterized membrane protein
MNTHELSALIVIFCVAVGTYSLRYFGLIFSGYFMKNQKIKLFLDSLPATILISLITPAIIKEGVIGIIATWCIAICVYKTKNILFSMLVGVGIVALGRNYL